MIEKQNNKALLWLKGQLALWVEDGVITAEQARALNDRYRLDEVRLKGVPARVITALSIIGALLVGAGMILLIASNWAAIPKPARLAMVISAILAINIAGYRLRFTRGDYPVLGAGLMFLGSIVYGAGIWLIAQTYNISSLHYGGFLLWFAGITPVAWLLELNAVLVVSAGLLSGWSIIKCLDFNTPNYLYPFLVATIIVPLCYKNRSEVSLATITLGFGIWIFQAALYHLGDGPDIVAMFFFYLAFGIFLYTAGILHAFLKRHSGFSLLYKALGAVIFFSFAYGMSFSSSAQSVSTALKTPLRSEFWAAFAAVAALSAVNAIISISLSKKHGGPARKQLYCELIFAGCALVVLSLMLAAPDRVFYGIYSNLILFATSVALIFLGYGKRAALFVNMGFIFFAVHFITRYVDWGWQYLPRSAFFILFGVVVLAGAALMEKERRKLVKAIRSGNG